MREMTGEELIEFVENELPAILKEQPHLRPIIFRYFVKAFPHRKKEIEERFGSDTTLFPQKKGDTD